MGVLRADRHDETDGKPETVEKYRTHAFAPCAAADPGLEGGIIVQWREFRWQRVSC